MKETNKIEAAVKKIVTDETTSKSKKMVALYKLGLEIKQVADIMNVRYNFVYNVVSNYCIANGEKIATVKKEGKKDLIVAMYLKGASNKEIAIELRTNYNYVFNVIKEYKLQNESAEQTASN